jgi:hypothetical protein
MQQPLSNTLVDRRQQSPSDTVADREAIGLLLENHRRLLTELNDESNFFKGSGRLDIKRIAKRLRRKVELVEAEMAAMQAQLIRGGYNA